MNAVRFLRYLSLLLKLLFSSFLHCRIEILDVTQSCQMSSPHSRSPGFSLHVTITIDPSNISAFLAAFRPCYEAVVAEPDCTYFEVFHSLDDPGVFRFVENWSKDPKWFQEVG